MKTKGGIADETAVIQLGGREFPVKGFTLDQIQQLMPALEESEKPLREGGWQAARQVLAAALSDQIGADELAEMKVTVREVMVAVQTIGVVSGLYQPGKSPAPEGAQSPSTGMTSTPKSA